MLDFPTTEKVCFKTTQKMSNIQKICKNKNSIKDIYIPLIQIHLLLNVYFICCLFLSCIYICLVLGFLIPSNDLCVYPSISTTLPWLMNLSSKPWNQIMSLQLCSSFSKLFWLFLFHYLPTYSIYRVQLGFWLGMH